LDRDATFLTKILFERPDVGNAPVAENRDFVAFVDSNGTFLGGTLLDKFLFEDTKDIWGGEACLYGVDEIIFDHSLDVVDIVRHNFEGDWHYVPDIAELDLESSNLHYLGAEPRISEDLYPRINGVIPWVLLMKDGGNDFDFGIEKGFTADRFHQIIVDGQGFHLNRDMVAPSASILEMLNSMVASHPHVDLTMVRAMLDCYQGNGVFAGPPEMVQCFASKIGCFEPLPLQAGAQYRIPTKTLLIGAGVAIAVGAAVLGGPVALSYSFAWLMSHGVPCAVINAIPNVILGAVVGGAGVGAAYKYVPWKDFSAWLRRAAGVGAEREVLGSVQGYYAVTGDIPPARQREAELRIGIAQELLGQDPNPESQEIRMNELVDIGVSRPVTPAEAAPILEEAVQRDQQVQRMVGEMRGLGDPQVVMADYESQKAVFAQRYQALEGEYKAACKALYVIPWNRQNGPQRKETQRMKAELTAAYESRKAAIQEEEQILDQAYEEYSRNTP
jgi:hypothetical protein